MSSPSLTQRAVLIAVTLAAVANFVLASALLGELTFNIVRVAIALVGGWLIVGRAGANLWLASFVGVLVLLVDLVLLKGGTFILAQMFRPDSVEGNGLIGLAGVVVSFFVFAPIAALVSLLGGLVARKTSPDVTAHP